MFGFISKLFGLDNRAELATYMKEGAIVVDVRTVAEYQNGSVKGAINIPLDQLTKQLHKLRKEENIVVFCRSGMRSGQAKRILESRGYKCVLNGGTWSKVAALKD